MKFPRGHAGGILEFLNCTCVHVCCVSACVCACAIGAFGGEQSNIVKRLIRKSLFKCSWRFLLILIVPIQVTSN